MPTNVTAEYLIAEDKYKSAKTKEEKIAALEEMISVAPKHKGMEHVLGGLKAKLSKLKKQQESSQGGPKRKTISVAKEGAAQICIVGLANVGKSTLINKLTESKIKVAKYPYTTARPEIGMLEYNDVKLQLIEVPSTFTPEVLSLTYASDVVVGVIRGEEDKKELEKLLPKVKGKIYWLNRNNDVETAKKRLWEYTGLIHVYTKQPGKKKEVPALTFGEDEKATVIDVAGKVHKDFVKKFKFARIYGPSAKFPGQQVGPDHILKDGDIVEIHTI